MTKLKELLSISLTVAAASMWANALPAAASSLTVEQSWGGYVYYQSTAIAQVTAEIDVPTITSCGATERSALVTWAGLDGFTDDTVEQAGLGLKCSDGHVGYAAWYELYPKGAVRVPITVRAGQLITFEVIHSASSTYTFKVDDDTTKKHWTGTGSLAGARGTTAECISEDLDEAIPHLSTIDFPECDAGSVRIPSHVSAEPNIEVNGVVRTAEHEVSASSFTQTITAG